MSEYVIDTLTWRSDRDVTLDLPVHADIVLIPRSTSLGPRRSLGARDGRWFSIRS